jgi:hypothetical protein
MPALLTPDVLKRYLRDMPRGHVFDLPYDLFAAVFPPGVADKKAWRQLRVLAKGCGFEVRDFAAEQRIELVKM